MAVTYDKIATTTLGSAQSSVTFSSISGSYTDLVIIVGDLKNTTSDTYLYGRFNSDTGNSYSMLWLSGTGSSAVSNVLGSRTDFDLDYYASTNTTTFGMRKININNYSNTTTYKTLLIRADRANSGTEAGVGLWRSTAAITSITLGVTAGQLQTGSTFTLYGIKAF